MQFQLVTCVVSGYDESMTIESRHRVLKRYLKNDDSRRILTIHKDKNRRILAHFGEVLQAQHMNLSGFELHPLKGGMENHWAVKVSKNRRIVFRFEGQFVYDVDLIDYH